MHTCSLRCFGGELPFFELTKLQAKVVASAREALERCTADLAKTEQFIPHRFLYGVVPEALFEYDFWQVGPFPLSFALVYTPIDQQHWLTSAHTKCRPTSADDPTRTPTPCPTTLAR